MGTRGRGATRARRGSAKPKGGGVCKSGLRLRLRVGRDASQDQQEGTPPPVIDFNQDGEQELEDKDDSSLPVGATRSGRVPKKRQEPDFAFGREMDHLWEISSARKADDEDAYQPRLVASLTPSRAPRILELSSTSQQELHKSGRARKSQPFTSTLTHISEADHLSSGAIQATHTYPSPRHIYPTFTADDTTLQLMHLLCNKSKLPIDLPTLSDPASDAENPYSATALTHLYITAYRASQHNICDLVADTWIRGFHALRRRYEKCHREDMLWRPNAALLQRRKKGYAPAPDWARDIPVDDPQLGVDALDFSPSLLSLLYAETRPGAGARLLWADAMALCGSKMEPRMQKRGEAWHPEFVRDVCCTALRMARRKLTLKIEEAGEGTWCKRYHEHWKAGAVCYRRAAWEKKIGGEEMSDENESEEKGTVVGNGKEKRGLEDEAEMGDAKRVRIEDREIVDEDAEGESDDE